MLLFTASLKPDLYRWSSHELKQKSVVSSTFRAVWSITLSTSLSSLMRDITSVSSENNNSSRRWRSDDICSVIFGKVWAGIPTSSWGQIIALATSSDLLRIHTDQHLLPPVYIIGSCCPSHDKLLLPGFILATTNSHTTYTTENANTYLTHTQRVTVTCLAL